MFVTIHRHKWRGNSQQVTQIRPIRFITFHFISWGSTKQEVSPNLEHLPQHSCVVQAVWILTGSSFDSSLPSTVFQGLSFLSCCIISPVTEWDPGILLLIHFLWFVLSATISSTIWESKWYKSTLSVIAVIMILWVYPDCLSNNYC